jgi:hypothetical protein
VHLQEARANGHVSGRAEDSSTWVIRPPGEIVRNVDYLFRIMSSLEMVPALVKAEG